MRSLLLDGHAWEAQDAVVDLPIEFDLEHKNVFRLPRGDVVPEVLEGHAVRHGAARLNDGHGVCNFQQMDRFVFVYIISIEERIGKIKEIFFKRTFSELLRIAFHLPGDDALLDLLFDGELEHQDVVQLPRGDVRLELLERGHFLCLWVS